MLAAPRSDLPIGLLAIADQPKPADRPVDEVAELILWLCSDACTFNTGAVFDMSGGRAKY
jgi:hypothetical protein